MIKVVLEFLFDNGESKYKCFLEWTQDNAIYVKPCFIMSFKSNPKQSKLNLVLDEWCMLQLIE
jgi:hypothetical protein